MTAVDLHQHLWPEPFVELLRRRTRAPYLRGWTLVTEGEPAYEIRPEDHDVERRIEQDLRAGVGLACVSLSAPLGIESLPRDQAVALVDAWHDGATALPDHFLPWASLPAAEPDLLGLAGLLGGRYAGVQLPATALETPAGWESLGAVLRVQVAGRAADGVVRHVGTGCGGSTGANDTDVVTQRSDTRKSGSAMPESA